MATTARVYRFEVSDYFFRLTTEAVRLFSNSVHQHRSFDQVIEERSTRANILLSSYEKSDLNDHLRIIPFDGTIELAVSLRQPSVTMIESALATLQDVLKAPLCFGEVISLMLFDLIVERNATELITKLGISSAEARDYRPRLKRRSASVAPIT